VSEVVGAAKRGAGLTFARDDGAGVVSLLLPPEPPSLDVSLFPGANRPSSISVHPLASYAPPSRPWRSAVTAGPFLSSASQAGAAARSLARLP
jgi:hypothetical protein